MLTLLISFSTEINSTFIVLFRFLGSFQNLSEFISNTYGGNKINFKSFL